MSKDDVTLLERVEQCEAGLTAIETILRVTFPKFFEPQEDHEHGHAEAISGAEKGPSETGEETSGEKEACAETSEVKE